MENAIRDFSLWFIPVFMFSVPILALLRGVNVYECFVQGAREGFGIAIRIIPYLIAMMMAVSIFRQSGMLEIVSQYGQPLFNAFHIPPEIIPLGIMRPFSGGGALGIAAELINAYGPDSHIGRLASTMQGSSDTTFFILAVYFGSVGVSRYRYSLFVGLLADVATFAASVYIVNRLFYG